MSHTNMALSAGLSMKTALAAVCICGTHLMRQAPSSCTQHGLKGGQWNHNVQGMLAACLEFVPRCACMLSPYGPPARPNALPAKHDLARISDAKHLRPRLGIGGITMATQSHKLAFTVTDCTGQVGGLLASSLSLPSHIDLRYICCHSAQMVLIL